MYEILDYLAMIEDPVRTPAYLAAMRVVIRPGDHVLEIGTGFGYFAVQACRFGAAHVWAVEPDDAIALGPAIAAANGCADRITFIQAPSQRVTLPRRADVLIEDLRGSSPLHGGRLATLADAHRRLLAPAARVIPRVDRLLCAPTEWPTGVRPNAADQSAMLHEVDVGAARRASGSVIRRSAGPPEALLAAGRVWATLDLRGPLDVHVQGETEFVAERAGRLAGISCWFASELAEGVGFDTAPTSAPTIYDRMVIPVAQPRAVSAGDRLRVALRATFDGSDYVWSWQLEGASSGPVGAWRDAGSTLGANLLSPARRARRAASFVPERSPAVEALRTLFDSVDGEASLEQIAARLRATHPALFAAEGEALRWAGERLAAAADSAES